MPLRNNTNNLNHTPDWKYFKPLLIPLNSAVAVISTFLLYFYPGLSTAIPQARVYLKTISAVSIMSCNKMSLFVLKTACINHIGILLCVLLSACTVSCQSHTSAGTKEDVGTGIKTECKNIEPEEAMLVINSEILNHIGIPLGR